MWCCVVVVLVSCCVVFMLFLRDSTCVGVWGEARISYIYIYIYTDYMRYFFLFSLEPNPIPEFQIDEDPPGRVGRKFGRVVDL